jgi:predicted RNA binding protein YcfA (HicA-like mRNA interferase family)
LKLPLLNAREVCHFLEKEGFRAERQTGSHKVYKHEDGRATLVPMHPGDLGRGLLLQILKQIGMERDEFLRKYR